MFFFNRLFYSCGSVLWGLWSGTKRKSLWQSRPWSISRYCTVQTLHAVSSRSSKRGLQWNLWIKDQPLFRKVVLILPQSRFYRLYITWYCFMRDFGTCTCILSVTFFVLLFRFIVPYFCLSVSKARPSWLSCSRCRNIAMTTWTSWNHSTKLCFSSTNVSQLPPLFYLRMIELWSVIDDVITEQAILKWYQDSHLQKGKSVFLKEMKPMVDWLLTAEEESDSETAAPNSWIIM